MVFRAQVQKIMRRVLRLAFPPGCLTALLADTVLTPPPKPVRSPGKKPTLLTCPPIELVSARDFIAKKREWVEKYDYRLIYMLMIRVVQTKPTPFLNCILYIGPHSLVIFQTIDISVCSYDQATVNAINMCY